MCSEPCFSGYTLFIRAWVRALAFYQTKEELARTWVNSRFNHDHFQISSLSCCGRSGAQHSPYKTVQYSLKSFMRTLIIFPKQGKLLRVTPLTDYSTLSCPMSITSKYLTLRIVLTVVFLPFSTVCRLLIFLLWLSKWFHKIYQKDNTNWNIEFLRARVWVIFLQ